MPFHGKFQRSVFFFAFAFAAPHSPLPTQNQKPLAHLIHYQFSFVIVIPCQCSLSFLNSRVLRKFFDQFYCVFALMTISLMLVFDCWHLNDRFLLIEWTFEALAFASFLFGRWFPLLGSPCWFLACLLASFVSVACGWVSLSQVDRFARLQMCCLSPCWLVVVYLICTQMKFWYLCWSFSLADVFLGLSLVRSCHLLACMLFSFRLLKVELLACLFRPISDGAVSDCASHSLAVGLLLFISFAH